MGKIKMGGSAVMEFEPDKHKHTRQRDKDGLWGF